MGSGRYDDMVARIARPELMYATVSALHKMIDYSRKFLSSRDLRLDRSNHVSYRHIKFSLALLGAFFDFFLSWSTR